MPTLIEHYKLEDGNEWAVLADGGSDYASIQTYICVPAGDLVKPAEEPGKAAASPRRDWLAGRSESLRSQPRKRRP